MIQRLAGSSAIDPDHDLSWRWQDPTYPQDGGDALDSRLPLKLDLDLAH
ncbi:hypothetical protein [Devosia nitrariae]|nr:hypothetical protein [Devosia nitrariae]